MDFIFLTNSAYHSEIMHSVILHLNHMGLDATKPVFGGFQQSETQTSQTS